MDSRSVVLATAIAVQLADLERRVLFVDGGDVILVDSISGTRRADHGDDLIELRNENGELAAYPVENPGFTEATSWADDFRGIRGRSKTICGSRLERSRTDGSGRGSGSVSKVRRLARGALPSLVRAPQRSVSAERARAAVSRVCDRARRSVGS